MSGCDVHSLPITKRLHAVGGTFQFECGSVQSEFLHILRGNNVWEIRVLPAASTATTVDAHYPHICPKCGCPAYVGLIIIDHPGGRPCDIA